MPGFKWNVGHTRTYASFRALEAGSGTAGRDFNGMKSHDFRLCRSARRDWRKRLLLIKRSLVNWELSEIATANYNYERHNTRPTSFEFRIRSRYPKRLISRETQGDRSIVVECYWKLSQLIACRFALVCSSLLKRNVNYVNFNKEWINTVIIRL